MALWLVINAACATLGVSVLAFVMWRPPQLTAHRFAIVRATGDAGRRVAPAHPRSHAPRTCARTR